MVRSFNVSINISYRGNGHIGFRAVCGRSRRFTLTVMFIKLSASRSKRFSVNYYMNLKQDGEIIGHVFFGILVVRGSKIIAESDVDDVP